MLLLKRISVSSLKRTRCQICQRSLTAKPSNSELETTQEHQEDDKLAKYAETLLYNSVIESKVVKPGFVASKVISSKQQKLRLALQTVQPLPLTLKYYSDDLEKSFNSEPDDHEGCSNVSPLESNAPAIFPYTNVNSKVDDVSYKKAKNESIKNEIIAKKGYLDRDNQKNWMSYYENFIEEVNEDETDITDVEPSKDDINYGTPDRQYPVSDTPCGGCGAYLHCQVSVTSVLNNLVTEICRTPQYQVICHQRYSKIVLPQ